MAEFLVLSTLVLVILTKHLSGRTLGVAGLLNMAVFFAAFLLLFRKTRKRINADDASLDSRSAAAAQSQRLHRAVKAYKRLMIMFAVFLIYGELINWDASAWMRVFGAVFDLCLIALSYRSMRVAQEKLRVLGELS